MLNFRALPTNASFGKTFFYRSGEILHIGEQEIRHLVDELRIQYFLDLRSKSELISHGLPNLAIDQGLKYINFPIESDDHYFRNKKYPNAVDYYNYNIALLQNNQRMFSEIFKFIAKNHHITIMFGCYAGKDRTGLMAILLLLMRKAPIDTIIEDYLASGQSLLNHIDHFEKNWIRKGLTREEYIERMQPKKKTVLMLLSYIDSYYKGITGYLEIIGLSKEENKLLCEPSSILHAREEKL